MSRSPTSRPPTAGPRRAPAAQSDVDNLEVLVVGGGMVGLSLGVMLAGAGLAVAVVDREDPAGLRDAGRDGRASALALGSQRALAGAGLWPGLAAEAQPILDIRVSDGQVGFGASSLFLHYDHREVAAGRPARPGRRRRSRAAADGGPEAASGPASAEPLGYMVENHALRRALGERVAALPNLRHLAPASVARLERGASRVEAELDDGRRLRARLLVAADGRNSGTREAAGIAAQGWRYDQTAIVCTLAHALPHQGTAHECFLPAGPFAMLPLTDGGAGQAPDGAPHHRSSIVWTEKPGLVPGLLARDDSELAREIERRFGGSLGGLSLLGRRWSYPLGVSWASRITDRRLALVGDAAHAIHPIAGQGFNLGLRDVAALAELVVDATRLGLDPGAPDLLERYRRWRQFDSVALLAVTDGLNRLFSNDLPPLRLARDLGLAAVQGMPAAKRFFMRHAMGLVGDLPRLVQGRPL